MTGPVRVLHLDDNSDDAQLIALALESEEENFPSVLTYVRTREEYLSALDRRDFDIILSDYRMAGFDGDQALEAAREKCPDIPFIMVTGEMGEERAVQTLQRGATDYVLKSRIFRLVPAVRRALHEAGEHRVIQEAARALNQSEQRLRAIFESVGVGILEIDASERILAANDRICQTLGYTREELLGMSLRELTAPQDREESDNVNADVRGGRYDTLAYEKRYLKRDNQLLWAHVTVSAIRDSRGAYVRSVGTIEDISERKLLERKIGDIARLPDENPSPVLRVSPDGWIQYANRASDPLLAAWRSHVGGMVPGEIRDAVRIALRSNVPQAITYSLSESTYSIDFAPVLTRNYVNLYARNITELERAEQAALLAQKQRSDILESIQDPFFALDSSWHFTFVNEKAQHLWWKKPVDMVGRSVWEIFPEPIGGTAYEDLRRSMVDRQVRHIETLSQSADTWFELHVYPTSDGGLAVTYRDIDARRKLEEALSIERATLQTACSRMSSRSSHAF